MKIFSNVWVLTIALVVVIFPYSYLTIYLLNAEESVVVYFGFLMLENLTVVLGTLGHLYYERFCKYASTDESKDCGRNVAGHSNGGTGDGVLREGGTGLGGH